MKGIDISMHNGAIDFNTIKNSGIEVVIIKATEGVDYVDPLLRQHYQGASGTGLNVGFYHFMSEKTNPTQQAIDFYNAIKDKEFNIIPTLDIEVNTYNKSAKEITDRCLEFLSKFKELSGLNCMIYTGGYFGRDSLDNRIKNYKAWIAHYEVSTPMETGFSNVVGHQYTEVGKVNGIKGNVDLNNFNDKIIINRSMVADNEVSKNNSWVARLQNECNIQGFSKQTVDGLIGLNTINGCPLMREGAKGNITGLLQEKLISLGYDCGIYGADGIWGIETTKSVIQFQKSSGLIADGVVGKNTWSRLINS